MMTTTPPQPFLPKRGCPRRGVGRPRSSAMASRFSRWPGCSATRCFSTGARVSLASAQCDCELDALRCYASEPKCAAREGVGAGDGGGDLRRLVVVGAVVA